MHPWAVTVADFGSRFQSGDAFAQPFFSAVSRLEDFEFPIGRCAWSCTRFARCFRQRPYFVEYTRSHPNSEVKRRKARPKLGWGTAREALRALLAFLYIVLVVF